MPLQERWLMENWEHIEANVTLAGGAVFDYVSGKLDRAPRWMTDHGLEWLGRLIIKPRRPVLSLSKGSGGATSSATRSFYTACSNNAWACCALGAESLFVDVAP